jgi:hypothetical protein
MHFAVWRIHVTCRILEVLEEIFHVQPMLEALEGSGKA